MEIPHDTVFVQLTSHEGVGYWTTALTRQGFAVVASGLELAVSQAAVDWIEEQK